MQLIDDEGDVAAADDVVGLERATRRGPRRVPLRKVPLVLPRSRTRQPAGVWADLGVAAADGAVVEDDLQRGEPAGAEEGLGLPRSCLRRRR